MEKCKDCKFLDDGFAFKEKGFCSVYNMFIKKEEVKCGFFKPREQETGRD